MGVFFHEAKIVDADDQQNDKTLDGSNFLFRLSEWSDVEIRWEYYRYQCWSDFEKNSSGKRLAYFGLDVENILRFFIPVILIYSTNYFEGTQI